MLQYRFVFLLLIIIFTAGIAFAEQGAVKVNVFPLPPALSASVQFYEPSGNNILDADETGKIIINIQNNGKGDAFDVSAVISANKRLDSLSYDRNALIGTIPAGGSISKEIELRASEDMPTESLGFNIEVKEANGFDAQPLKIAFRTKAFEPPKLVVADIGIEDQNKNYKVEPMEIVEITARIQNMGHGDARNVTANVQFGDNVFVAGDSGTNFDLGGIPAGKFKDIKFMFYTNNRIKNGEQIPINIDIKERRPKFSVSKPLALAMNAPQRKAEEVIVKGRDTDSKPDIQLATGLSIDVDMNVPEGEKAGKFDVAVIIGNKHYSASGSPDIEYADRDARIMKEYLVKTFGFDAENIIYVEDAGFAKFNEVFGSERDHRGRLFQFVKPGKSKVFIYYVGHGAPDLDSNEAYFVPVDANPKFIKTNGYMLQTFYNNLSKIPAKKITIVLDSCFSGNSEKGLLFKDISPSLVKVKKEYQGPANATIITSAAVDQVSTWYHEKKHSLFTYYFLKGIQGEADINKDKRITIGEMKEYLKENVPYKAQRLTGTAQHPVITGNDADVLVTLKK
ncbi:MAG: caspase family protein [Nitrospirae bacterium]|nr:caspase family protein [Nitrospirota bacterium]MCL5977484.1 caspase family protein [Nitrospirota bacterium]